jgi:hypothetical protein
MPEFLTVPRFVTGDEMKPSDGATGDRDEHVAACGGGST